MDALCVKDDRVWDTVRLKDIQPEREATYGSKYAHRVLSGVSSDLLQCQCVRKLLPFLVAHNVLTNEACAIILSKPESEDATNLHEDLTEIAAEPDSQRVIENFYLSLLDFYESSQNTWCRHMATVTLRQADLRRIHVNVVLPNAAQLKHALGLKGGSSANLKDIIQQGIREKPGFCVPDLVLGLLQTPSLGKYMSLLVPYCCCNSPAVCEYILSLLHHWRRLATHLGYSKIDIDGIVSTAGVNNVSKQIQLFLRIWWIPDCGEDKMLPMLKQVIQENSIKPLPVKGDGQALLKACMENDWKTAATLIQSGSHLGARSSEGRTPLMYACVKSQDRIVQMLIEHGADPEVLDKRGDGCLHYPETLRNRAILECLLNKYKQLHISVDLGSQSSGCSPLSIACKCVAVNSAELLLDHGANPNGSSNGRHRPLVEASYQGHVGLVKLLLKYRADVNTTGKDNVTALLKACTSNQWNVAQVLLDEGADVNKCGDDCTSPLFAAVSANNYIIASALIKKGAVIDVVGFQPGAVEGTVEITPLAHAARNGFQKIVKLLIDKGANVNFLCSDTMPAIGFSIIGDHIETFHVLLECEHLDKSIMGLSTPIITSVKTEKYYYTEKLLEILGGAKQALMEAQRNQMELLAENTLMYMQAVNHPQLDQVSFIPEQYGPPGVLRTPKDQHKIDEVLRHFSQICVSAIMNSPVIPHDSLEEVAHAMGNVAVANFFRGVLSNSLSPDEVRIEFLSGAASPLQFLISNKMLNTEMFQVEVLKYHPDDAESFYEDLIWTFRNMNGGADLPTNIHAMLTQLFSGRFTPRTTDRRVSRGGSYRAVSSTAYNPSVPPVRSSESYHGVSQPEYSHLLQPLSAVESLPDQKTFTVSGELKVPSCTQFPFKGINFKLRHIAYSECDLVQSNVDKDLKHNLVKTDLNSSFPTLPSSTESEKSNASLPLNKSKSVQKVVENVQNNLPDTTDTDTDNTSTSPLLKPPLQGTVPTAGPSIPTPTQSVSSFAPPLPGPSSPPATESEKRSISEEHSDEEMDFRLPNCTVNPTGVHLGHGSYGDVVEVEYKRKKYAAKKYRHANIENLMHVFGREHEILSRIRHPNIVPYYGIGKLATDNTTVIVMERMATNLSAFLEDKRNVNLTLQRKFQLLLHIVQGLNHLHTQKPAIIHRDLTATNVLVDTGGVAKIGDFGNSRTIDMCATPELLTSTPGTLDYMPQEALGGGEYNNKLDIFSFGHLSIFVLIQHRPHPLQPSTYIKHGELKARTEVERRVVYLDEVKTKLADGEQHELYSIIIGCLRNEPHKRPSCADILASRLFGTL